MYNYVYDVMPSRLARSNKRILTGVCAGLAHKLGVDPWLVRALWILAVFAFGAGIPLYLVLSFTVPREDRIEEFERPKLLGVCHRLALRFGVETSIVRTLAVLFGLASLGFAVVVYVALYFISKDSPSDFY